MLLFTVVALIFLAFLTYCFVANVREVGFGATLQERAITAGVGVGLFFAIVAALT